MVRIKRRNTYDIDGTIMVEAWLEHMSENPRYANHALLRNAVVLTQLSGSDRATPNGESCLQQGLRMAELLADLELDVEGIAASIIYPSVQYAELSLDDVEEQLGSPVMKLIRGVQRMDALHALPRQDRTQPQSQLDNIRKMLLAMVDDVRVVLIKLTERLCVLRAALHLGRKLQQEIAQECMHVFAPLANRLGLGQIKWEMEDLAFRFLQPNEYKLIAKGLKAKRIERDLFVQEIVETLKNDVAALGITHYKIQGRAKHINSIYKKMQRKNVDIEQITDATAVRVLVDNVTECYQVLSLVHTLWQHISDEFDDYIANPKSNGYQSLHTAVTGPQGRIFEVQIRTFDMHSLAERGVAAHWAYKEDARIKKTGHERRIEWLREVLEWQKEISGESADQLEAHHDDRIYLFTPEGDIKDLATGATPLDFAYAIHSQVGHRCKGAKINGKIVPLTHQLKTGDEVEILTGKHPNPSRDWLNPHLGYITTTKARAKLHHWFRLQEFDRHLELGKELFEKECHKLNLGKVNLDDIALQLHFKTSDDLLAALGGNDVRINAITNKIQNSLPLQPTVNKIPLIAPRKRRSEKGISIQGIDNLMTNIARCCQPLPGEQIIGYITLNRGITIHRKDCPHVQSAKENKLERLIDVDWGTDETQQFQAQIQVIAFHRATLINDITGILSHDKINLLGMNTATDPEKNRMFIRMSVEIESLSSLSKILDKISQLSHVTDAKRVEL